MATVAGSKLKLYDIDSADLYTDTYQSFLESIKSKGISCPAAPESYRILSRHPNSTLQNFPSNFPAAKRIPGTRFVVDEFRSAGPFSVTYFLTHFHADHYVGLNPHWGRGLIFCSEVTARLLVESLKVSEALVVSLTVGEMVRIDGSEVTLIDANHCPGAVQILFRVYEGDDRIKRYVHTGDMRYSSSMKLEPALCDFIGADAVFLDTTYCNPKFVFPSQTESVEYVVNTIQKIMSEENSRMHENSRKSSVLFLISTYVVGKEKILLAVSRCCNCLVHVDERKLSVLNCLDLAETGVFTTDSSVTNVHVVGWNVLGETWPYFRPNFGNMERIMRERGYGRVVGFVPTGWMYEAKRDSFPVRTKGIFEIHLVPYSEHSSYDELREYVEFLRPRGIIPTVGLEGRGLDSKQAASMMKYFANLVDETAHKRKFLKGFNRKAVTGGPSQGRGFEEEVDEDQDEDKKDKEDEDFGMDTVYKQGPSGVAGREKTCTVEAFELNLITDSTLADAMEETKDENLSHTQSCSKFASSTCLVSGEAVTQLAPKAFFGKGARKKKMLDGPSSSSLIVNMDPLADASDASKGTWKWSGAFGDISEVPSGDANGNFPSLSGDCEIRGLGAFEVEEAAAEMDETLEELKTCLPNWVTADQMKDLLTRSQGDIPVAVSEFYERETEFREQVVISCQINPPANEVVMVDKSVADHLSKQINCVSNAILISEQGSSPLVTFDNNGFKLADTCTRIANQNTKPTSKSSSRRRNTGSKLNEWSIDSKSKKKSKFALESLSNQSKQPVITNFFRKADLDDTPPAVDPGIASHESAPKVAARVESDDLETAFMLKNTGKLYGKRLTQFLQILDGSLSEQDALILLDKAKGDINAALDLYYSAYNELSDKEPGRPGSNSDKCISSVQTSRESTSYITAEPTTLSTQKLSECSIVDGKTCSVALPFEKYNPVDHACWHAGELAPYLHLSRTFDLVEQESGKLKTTVMLCNMFRSLLALSPEDVLPTVYLCTNRIAPDYENVDLNIGAGTVMAAIEEAFGMQKAKLREMYNNMGDLGDVAQACRQTQSMLTIPRPLSIRQVFLVLQQISKEGGSGSGARKKGLILSLLRSCREKETKFIVRTLVRNMRIGAMMRTILPALAQAVIINSSVVWLQKGATDSLRMQLQDASVAAMEAYNILPNLNLLVPMIVDKGIDFVSSTLSMSPGVPIKPMLAKIANGVHDVLKCFEGKAFTCEYKYDGQRAQVHMLMDGSIRIFSRNCEDSTSRFPDVVEIVRSSTKTITKTFILDAEVVAIDRHNGNKIMAFQNLSSRERGRNGSLIQTQNIKVDVCIFIFDLMFANGEQLLALPLRERRKRIRELFCDAKPGLFQFANEITVEADEACSSSASTTNKVDIFLEASISSSCEGIMVKALDDNSDYAPSKRSDTWLKVKRDYVEGLHETLDLVPIGAWHGNGRKAGWFSPFLLACYNPDCEEYQSVCRVMSGFTDAFYKEMELYFSERVLTKKPTYYQTLEEPDLWFPPELVWEIRGADLTISPVHQAAVGLVHPSRGISMRFPRFIRQRIDKSPEDSSTPLEIVDLFHRQTCKTKFGIDAGIEG